MFEFTRILCVLETVSFSKLRDRALLFRSRTMTKSKSVQVYIFDYTRNARFFKVNKKILYFSIHNQNFVFILPFKIANHLSCLNVDDRFSTNDERRIKLSTIKNYTVNNIQSK